MPVKLLESLAESYQREDIAQIPSLVGRILRQLASNNAKFLEAVASNQSYTQYILFAEKGYPIGSWVCLYTKSSLKDYLAKAKDLNEFTNLLITSAHEVCWITPNNTYQTRLSAMQETAYLFEQFIMAAKPPKGASQALADFKKAQQLLRKRASAQKISKKALAVWKEAYAVAKGQAPAPLALPAAVVDFYSAKVFLEATGVGAMEAFFSDNFPAAEYLPLLQAQKAQLNFLVSNVPLALQPKVYQYLLPLTGDVFHTGLPPDIWWLALQTTKEVCAAPLFDPAGKVLLINQQNQYTFNSIHTHFENLSEVMVATPTPWWVSTTSEKTLHQATWYTLPDEWDLEPAPKQGALFVEQTEQQQLVNKINEAVFAAVFLGACQHGTGAKAEMKHLHWALEKVAEGGTLVAEVSHSAALDLQCAQLRKQLSQSFKELLFFAFPVGKKTDTPGLLVGIDKQARPIAASSVRYFPPKEGQWLPGEGTPLPNHPQHFWAFPAYIRQQQFPTLASSKKHAGFFMYGFKNDQPPPEQQGYTLWYAHDGQVWATTGQKPPWQAEWMAFPLLWKQKTNLSPKISSLFQQHYRTFFPELDGPEAYLLPQEIWDRLQEMVKATKKLPVLHKFTLQMIALFPRVKTQPMEREKLEKVQQLTIGLGEKIDLLAKDARERKAFLAKLTTTSHQLAEALEKLTEVRRQATQRLEQVSIPEKIFAYLYAVLHSPEYQQVAKAALADQPPGIPFHEDFWGYAEAGEKLLQLHLNWQGVKPELELLPAPVEMSEYANLNLKADPFGHTFTIGKHLLCEQVPLKAWHFEQGGKALLHRLLASWQQEAKEYKKGNGGAKEAFAEGVAASFAQWVTICLQSAEVLELLDQEASR